MKTKNVISLLVSVFIFSNSNFAQSNIDFESMETGVLFADSLVMKNQTDKSISQLKKELSSNSTGNNFDLIYYNLAVCYSAKKQHDSTCLYLSKCIFLKSYIHQ